FAYATRLYRERWGAARKTEFRSGRKDVEVGSRESDRAHEQQRQKRDEEISRFLHLDEDRGAQTKRDHRKKLVRQSKQWPERVDPAERIDHALIQKPAPGRDQQNACHEIRRPR